MRAPVQHTMRTTRAAQLLITPLSGSRRLEAADGGSCAGTRTPSCLDALEWKALIEAKAGPVRGAPPLTEVAGWL